MDILTLELQGFTLYQVLLSVRNALDTHAGMALRLHLDGDETVRHNLRRLLEKAGREVAVAKEGTGWRMDAGPGEAPPSPPPGPVPAPAPLLVPAFPAARLPVLLLRSAFAPGDRALGRRLLLDTLRGLDPATPWVCLAHEALELLEDPRALEVLRDMVERGVPVKVSQASLDYLIQDSGGFEPVDDREWQGLLGKGGIVAL